MIGSQAGTETATRNGVASRSRETGERHASLWSVAFEGTASPGRNPGPARGSNRGRRSGCRWSWEWSIPAPETDFAISEAPPSVRNQLYSFCRRSFFERASAASLAEWQGIANASRFLDSSRMAGAAAAARSPSRPFSVLRRSAKSTSSCSCSSRSRRRLCATIRAERTSLSTARRVISGGTDVFPPSSREAERLATPFPAATTSGSDDPEQDQRTPRAGPVAQFKHIKTACAFGNRLSGCLSRQRSTISARRRSMPGRIRSSADFGAPRIRSRYTASFASRFAAA